MATQHIHRHGRAHRPRPVDQAPDRLGDAGPPAGRSPATGSVVGQPRISAPYPDAAAPVPFAPPPVPAAPAGREGAVSQSNAAAPFVLPLPDAGPNAVPPVFVIPDWPAPAPARPVEPVHPVDRRAPGAPNPPTSAPTPNPGHPGPAAGTSPAGFRTPVSSDSQSTDPAAGTAGVRPVPPAHQQVASPPPAAAPQPASQASRPRQASAQARPAQPGDHRSAPVAPTPQSRFIDRGRRPGLPGAGMFLQVPAGLAPYLPSVLNTAGGALLVVASLIAIAGGAGSTAAKPLFGPAGTLLSAPGQAFWVWWVILLATLPFMAWQWLPKLYDPERLELLSKPTLLAGIGQLAWVLVARTGHLIIAGVLMIGTLVALCLVVWRLAKLASPGWVERLATDIGWGSALGWVCVELLMLCGAVIEQHELLAGQPLLIAAIVLLCILIGGSLGLAGRLYRQYSVGLALAWGVSQLGWKLLVGEPRSYILGALALSGVFLVLSAFYASGRRRRHHVQGLEERPWR